MDLNPKYDDYYFPTTSAVKQPGHAGSLEKEHIDALHEFRAELEKLGYTDRLDTLTLLRFLRARQWDVKKATEMFKGAEDWRKDVKLDEVLPDWTYPEKEQIEKYYSQYYHKTDKDGRPVYIEHLGGIQMDQMEKIVSQDRMLLNLAVEYERVADPRLPACSHKAGHLLETCCTIMDLKGVGLFGINRVYPYISKASEISQNYYPERLGKLYIINAPWAFGAIWTVVKGWLDPVTVSKIHIISSNPKKALLEQISAENLPKELGGECQCPGGCKNSDAGPWQDPEHARTPKWAQKDGKTIENKGSEIETPSGAEVADASLATDADAATQPAAA